VETAKQARIETPDADLDTPPAAATRSPEPEPEPVVEVADDQSALETTPEVISRSATPALGAPPALGGQASEPSAPAAGTLGIADVRRLWPGVLDRVKEIRRLPWVVLSQNAQLLALDGDTLTIGLVNTGARDSFVSTGSVEVLRKAMQEVLGVSWNVDAIVDPTSAPTADEAPEAADATKTRKRGSAAPESVRQAVKDGPTAQPDDLDAAAHPDDPVIDSPLDPEQLVATELGGKVIDEST